MEQNIFISNAEYSSNVILQFLFFEVLLIIINVKYSIHVSIVSIIPNNITKSLKKKLLKYTNAFTYWLLKFNDKVLECFFLSSPNCNKLELIFLAYQW